MMLPLRITGFTRVLAEDQDEFKTLAIRDVVDPDTGQNCMVSAWEPTPEDLRILNEGGRVLLGIMGTVFPPVFLTTAPLENPPDDDQG